MQLSNNVIANLAFIIHANHLKQGELAEAAGITRVQLNRIVNGKSRTTVDTCELLAIAAGLPADALFMPPLKFRKMFQENLVETA